MARVHHHTVANYYEMVDNGTIANMQSRIAVWIRDKCPPLGITRNTLRDRVFYLLNRTTYEHFALDGGPAIAENTLRPRILELVDDEIIKQSAWVREDPDSKSSKCALHLFPHTTPDWKLKYPPEQWANYLRKYPQQQQAELGL